MTNSNNTQENKFNEFTTKYLNENEQTSYTFDSVDELIEAAKEMGYDLTVEDINTLFPEIVEADKEVREEALYRMTTEPFNCYNDYDDMKRGVWGKDLYKIVSKEFDIFAWEYKCHIAYTEDNMDDFNEYFYSCCDRDYQDPNDFDEELFWHFWKENGYADDLEEWVNSHKEDCLEMVEKYLNCDIKITIFNDCEPEVTIKYPWEIKYDESHY